MPRPVQRKRAPGAALRAESCFFFLCALHPENGFPGAGRTGFTACAAAADGYGRTSCCAGTVGALVLFGKIFSDGYALFKKISLTSLWAATQWSQQRFRCRHCSGVHTLRSLFSSISQHNIASRYAARLCDSP